MKCTTCGAELRSDARYCTACGIPVLGSDGGQEPVPPDSGFSQPTASRGGHRTLIVVLAVVTLFLAGLAAAVLLRHKESPAQSTRPTIGKSVQGRAIQVVSFGTGARHLLVVGGVHGDEYGSQVAEQLITFLRAHPEALPPGTRLDVVPCLNPDGLAADTRANADSVDLNRNFPTSDWAGTLSKKDYSGQLHLSGGTAPASEPETQTLVRVLRSGYVAVVSLHSHGGILDFNGPGGRAMARRMSRLCGLRVDHVALSAVHHGFDGHVHPSGVSHPRHHRRAQGAEAEQWPAGSGPGGCRSAISVTNEASGRSMTADPCTSAQRGRN